MYAASLQLYVRSLADTEPRRIAGTRIDGTTARFPVFSPDGRSVAFWSQTDQTVRKVPVSGGVSVALGEIPYPTDRDGTPKVLPLSAGTYGNPRVSPDGARIAFGTDDGTLAEVTCRAGRPTGEK